MGFFDWLMKGIGFESDEDDIKKEKKKKKKEQKEEPVVEVPQEPAAPENTSFDGSNYNAFGGVDANSFSAQESSGNDYAPENGISGYGTKNVVIHRPKTYKEVQGLIDYLKQGESAIMILEGLSQAEAQRILDFVSGAVYALSGSTQRIDGNIFLLTPEGYNIVS